MRKHGWVGGYAAGRVGWPPCPTSCGGVHAAMTGLHKQRAQTRAVQTAWTCGCALYAGIQTGKAATRPEATHHPAAHLVLAVRPPPAERLTAPAGTAAAAEAIQSGSHEAGQPKSFAAVNSCKVQQPWARAGRHNSSCFPLSTTLSGSHKPTAPLPVVELRHHSVHGRLRGLALPIQQRVGGAVELGVGGLGPRGAGVQGRQLSEEGAGRTGVLAPRPMACRECRGWQHVGAHHSTAQRSMGTAQRPPWPPRTRLGRA